ncbi:hypothetical protein PAAG_05990 [Paracoccidioides lutzii Pb01]|uniref:Uncharacterized protein n=1 Tax=Paracoccidioides lutzii (strain ATCC MYA-826 / Pb01) TaxID=502779 RepID=C1H5E9_PARBA|nr:hypothetical protein PAAG_05990 [Paracoccidioides lutzii Pb01]EEH34943.2 hypothetical protein PAAG_05990 [Paracoccidioides lutzii Pb01]
MTCEVVDVPARNILGRDHVLTSKYSREALVARVGVVVLDYILPLGGSGLFRGYQSKKDEENSDRPESSLFKPEPEAPLSSVRPTQIVKKVAGGFSDGKEFDIKNVLEKTGWDVKNLEVHNQVPG